MRARELASTASISLNDRDLGERVKNRQKDIREVYKIARGSFNLNMNAARQVRHSTVKQFMKPQLMI